MNDFTKEDLLCLYNAIDLQIKNIAMSERNVTKRRELRAKIQNMIENYNQINYWDNLDVKGDVKDD
ncbi:hypothetical protein UFOVP98_53 [uncultured Caudovirales phage]|jgi:hypothetical protein|uniref:Uncharacterized protein n=1 Tax=uncultured Caudovirales phage TaxID=2100421 RepID=A0A6J5KZA7_9CAUD|nr:hypothetical protein UFOVP98_53 [uncultured Caudovirales phage]CAB4134166.1 hypothetical protein UFOVP269_17 [uncultured Caudovirales phage]